MAAEGPGRGATLEELLGFRPGNAICYSGYRAGQSPDAGVFPTREEVREDLLLLAPHWSFLRLYDCTRHAELVLDVIREEGLPVKVLLGAWLAGEVDNPACPWGGVHGPERLARNREANREELRRLARLADLHRDTVAAVAVGNEALVGWTDHLVPREQVLAHVRGVRGRVAQPVTVCENHVPWREGLDAIAAELDFLSVHSYPVWESREVGAGLAHTVEDWRAVAARHPGKPVVLTEVGWPTRSNGRGILPGNASPAMQATYLTELLRWTRDAGVLAFLFEAFDERWKGSPDPDEPEKHWGIFTEDRRPKPAFHRILPYLSPGADPARRSTADA
ncbi:MAG TPA: glycosyl hydrolase family 17 protein [Anaeromyxobacteraceae bacterium]|nr:glycosyl hydrolase family 17 protein [Anaeromyxobacteraceae bacterium]